MVLDLLLPVLDRRSDVAETLKDTASVCLWRDLGRERARIAPAIRGSRKCLRERLQHHGQLFTGECVVLVKRFISPKAVGIDSQRLLVVVSQQESDYRFIGSYR